MAGKENTVSRVKKIIEPFAAELGLEIWDVRFVKEGTDWYLKIFIDKNGGVSIDDCVDLTHAVTKPLDEADPISQSYILEVSSPGVERELTEDSHFEKYIGSAVTVRLIRPVDGVRDFAGSLVSYDRGGVVVRIDGGRELAFNKKDASYVKLDDFNISDFNNL